MSYKKWSDIRDERFSKEHVDQVRHESLETLLELNLRELRERAGKTQSEVAEGMETHQPELSRIEARRDHMLSTLRRYVDALGGELKITAVLDGDRVAFNRRVAATTAYKSKSVA